MAITSDESRAFLGVKALAFGSLFLNVCTGTHTVAATSVATHFVKGETSVAPATSYYLPMGSWSGANSAGTYTATQLTTGGTFTFTYSASVGTIYSYAITTGSGLTGTLVGAEMFSPAQVITANGDKISVVVKLLTA
jgi:hypothetical protein